MSDKKFPRNTAGASVSGNGTPSRMNTHLQKKLGVKSQLNKQFKSPLSKNRPSSTSSLTDAQLEAKLSTLQSQIQDTDREIAELQAGGYVESELQVHIDKLHEYNEIKDVGQMVLGRLAVMEGVQTKDLYPRYSLDLKD